MKKLQEGPLLHWWGITSQMNIMISTNTPAGKAKLTVKFDQKSASTEFMIHTRDE